MSEWYWRVIALKAAFVLACFVSYLHADDTVKKLPFCNTPNANDGSGINDLLIVSTLDGQLTAFSTHDGVIVWNLETQPLLSSNLHHVELTAAGKWVRLVPSLRGTLYSLSGDTIEPLPFDAEQLLSSSFKYSDDLVIAGARETLWQGIDANTGGVIYECGTTGCSGEQQTAGAGRDVLVLRRHSNTVRALDPRSGQEKWNFSVAEHQLALSRRECAGASGAPVDGPAGALAVAVALPEGVVAVTRPDDRQPLWQHKLDAPVAGMWRLRDGALQNIDVLWEATQSLVQSPVHSPPSLYIGVHDRQLYIQEGILYAQKLETAVSAKPLPWKLMNTRPLVNGRETALTLQDSDPNTLSLITLYGNTGQTGNHGFFLYLQDTCDQAVQVTEEAIDGPDIVLPNNSDDTEHHHVHVHVYSLWFWWKEVLLIAISSALLMNLMIWPRFIAPKVRAVTPVPVNQEYIVVERHYERPPSNTSQEYSGRYENDFTPLRCLGRGGFGVVFEARNNIDHCSYAVKRITLPRTESKRERVLREVRALAKLEHENIVRYFNAWLEEPPPLWQQQRDAVWMRELDGVSVAMTEEYTATSPPPFVSRPKEVMLNLNKPLDDCIDALDYEKKLGEPSKRLRSLSCNDSFSIVFDENASNPQLTTSTKTPSKHSTSPKTSTKHSTSNDLTHNTSKNLPSDDSFIVFANSEDHNQTGSGLSEARKNSSFDKRLEKVKSSEFKVDNSHSKKKKKGHTRHWSLDLCVKSDTASAPTDCKMYLYIQMQLCLRDSLHDWLRQNRTCDARVHKVKTLFSQIVSAVEYVHLAGLIHRDLKPSNIFFAPDGRVKVGDFGLVTAMNDSSQDGEPTAEVDVHARHTYRVGTHLYMSPEQLLGRPYSYKVDIYSLGLILFELLQPFGTESERVASLLRLRNAHYPPHFSTEYPNEMEVLKLMLSDDPNQRPTASGVKARAPLYERTDDTWHFTLPNLAVN